MVLATHQVERSYVAFPSRPLLCNRVRGLKQYVSMMHMIKRTDRFISSRCRSCLSIGAPLARGWNGKSFKILGFKGTGQSDESSGRATGSKSTKNSIKLSYVPQGTEETSTESPKVQNLPVSYTSKADDTTVGSLAIQKLLKNWLILLRTPSLNQVEDDTLEEPSSSGIKETQNGIQEKERGEILKLIWCHFLGLDATIKIPLVIFIPLYPAVNLIYGAEVSRELTPLWVLGPLIVALYVKMFQALCALYVFSFKLTVKVVKNLPTYYLMTYGYIIHGKLKEDIKTHLWQPVVDIRSLDYKEVSKRKLKHLEGWLVERYLDFVESIWPYYCRTIRFLKRANLI